MKSIFVIFISLTTSLTAMTQDTVRVYINNTNKAEAIVKNAEANPGMDIKMADLKSAGSFFIVITGEHINSELYKRSLEISGKKATVAAETDNKPGHFVFKDLSFKKELAAGSSVPLYLILDPANPMMLMPSKKIPVGELIIK